MIDILMATYNGERYLRAQLDSILHQSNQDWHLIIRDDCSTDGTVQIIREYQLLRPEQITLIRAEQPSGSAQNNFFQLIQYWQQNGMADYIMFADQDDVWLSHKVQITLETMHQLEQQYGNDKPLLVHTDLAVVDEQLRSINPSLFRMQNMDPTRDKLNNILVQNIVTGCTMMTNRTLLQMVTTIPQHAIMHDMWLALITSAFGYIGFVPQATMLYRQHGNNANGAKNVKTMQYLLWKLRSGREIHNGLVALYRQAAEFDAVYHTQLTRQQQNMIRQYSRLEHVNILKKFQVLMKYKLHKKGVVRVLGQLLR